MTSNPAKQVEWSFPVESTLPPDFLPDSQYKDFVRQAVWSRGITSTEKAIRYLDWRKYSPSSSFELPDMEVALERIQKAIRSNQTIGIWGDFDVDGQTSTSLLVSAFRMLNIPCHYRVPIRAAESHGIKLEPLKEFLAKGIDLLITCDTGISEVQNIAYAQSSGVDVIITDHHILPEVIPDAHAIINPRRLDQTHPLYPLAGVGTAYKLAEALLDANHLSSSPALLHDLVALGTVADQASLVDDNRFLVQSGLEHIRQTPRPALRRMLEFSEFAPPAITESQLAFLLAPRLNALGRLADANPAVSFLLSDNAAEIEDMTLRLEELNSSRKILGDQVFNGAMAMIEQDPSLADQPALLLRHQDWPAGIIGITASRLVEIFRKPVIILTQGTNGVLKGSARTIEGVDIAAILRENEDQLLSYGGHPMAAGLSLKEEDYFHFSREIQAAIQKEVEGKEMLQTLKLDLRMPVGSLDIAQVRNLELLAPFGPGNPALICFDHNLTFLDAVPIGRNSEHLKVTVEDERSNQATLLWWNGNGLPIPQDRFDLAFTVHSSNYKGREQAQLEWVDFRENTRKIVEIISSTRKLMQNIDLRGIKDPIERISALNERPLSQIWQEGLSERVENGRNRSELERARSLVIWTAPPNSESLREVLNHVHPKELIWVLRKPGERDQTSFLKSLWTLISELPADNLVIENSKAYSRLACTREQLLLGFKWLSAAGKITIEEIAPTSYRIRMEGQRDEPLKKEIERSLSLSLAESNAFFNFLMRADLDALVNDLG